MTNRAFDQWLRDSLASIRPEHGPEDWDAFVKRVEKSEADGDAHFDEAIRSKMESMRGNAVPDWDQMQQKLEADELQFDTRLKETIEQYEAPYNPETWPVLDARITEEERTRRRLVTAKVLEIAAILIALFTFYNVFPGIRDSDEEAGQTLTVENQFSNSASDNQIALNGAATSASATVGETRLALAAGSLSGKESTTLSSEQHAMLSGSLHESRAATHVPVLHRTISGSALQASQGQLSTVASANHFASIDPAIQRTAPQTLHPSTRGIDMPSPLQALDVERLSPPASHESKVRFGMSAAADVNSLYMPEQHFYSQGRVIDFSQKQIVAGGYTAGASLLFDAKRFLFETGFTYSSKSFEPDRSFFNGSTLDAHQLDFENITLNIISIPLYLHWKIDGKGLWRIYSIGGASMHVIANAHYDLITQNYFSSAAAPQDPLQLQNQREIQRIREHMLDGSKFSTKGYLTAVGGLGIERYLNDRMSVFVQPMYQYQIPFFGLIDQNGKHLQNGTLLFGTRISL